MLKKRVLSTLIGVPVLVIILRFGGLPFLGLNLAIITLAINEYFGLIKNKGINTNKLLAAAISWLFIIGVYFKLSFLGLAGILTLGLLIILLKQILIKDDGSPLLTTATTLFGIFYVAVLFSYLIVLYQLNFNGRHIGPIVVWLPILATWMTDTAAYFTGLNLGKHPLAPEISPNKTIEGSVGGVIGSIVITVLLSEYLLFGYGNGILLGLVIGVIAQLGDLCESAFKRDAEIKDTGELIPGHGGMLDRIDSLLFTLPVVYYYLQFFILK